MSEHRPTIVLVHGAFANAGCWSKLIPLLMAKGFEVVATEVLSSELLLHGRGVPVSCAQ